MNIPVRSREIPQTWRKSYLRPTFKSGDPTVPGNYRGISFTAHLLKMLTWTIAERLRKQHGHQINQNQYGFMRGKSCEKAVVKLLEYIDDKGGKCYGLFVDFAKAFDKVPRDQLLQRLKDDFEVEPGVLAVVRALLLPTEIVVSDATCSSEIIQQKKGLPQGDSLSPFLFIMYHM